MGWRLLHQERTVGCCVCPRQPWAWKMCVSACELTLPLSVSLARLHAPGI